MVKKQLKESQARLASLEQGMVGLRVELQATHEVSSGWGTSVGGARLWVGHISVGGACLCGWSMFVWVEHICVGVVQQGPRVLLLARAFRVRDPASCSVGCMYTSSCAWSCRFSTDANM